STTHHPPRPTLFPYTTLFRSRTRDLQIPRRRPYLVVDGIGEGRSHRPRGDRSAQSGRRAGLRSGSRLWAAAGPRTQASTTSGLRDRKSTRLNSSHVAISYAVF